MVPPVHPGLLAPSGDEDSRGGLRVRGAGQCNGMTASPLGEDVRFVCVAAQAYGGVFKEEGAKRMAESLTAFANPNPKFAHAARYDKLTAGLAKYPGATDAEKAAAYAKSIGVTDAEIAAIRRLLLK